MLYFVYKKKVFEGIKMILLKSFFRKKTTKNYFIIFLITIILLVVFIIGKNYCINLINENYTGSFIQITDTKDKYQSLLNNSSFKSVKKGVIYGDDNDNIVIIEASNIKEDNVIYVSNEYSELINKTINVYNTDLKIIDTYNSNVPNQFIGSKNTIEKLIEKTNKTVFLVDLNNWNNYDKVVNKLNKEYKNILTYINEQSDFDYKPVITALDIFIILNIIILIIVIAIACFNIIEDEKKINTLYNYIGYSKIQIKLLTFAKIIFLVISNLLICLVIYIILENIFLS